jgi:hypothetical protein
MGSAYDQKWPPSTPFAMETYAIAKALAYDGYGCNQRLANNFNPAKAQLVTGMLQRWERIFGTPPIPGDTERTRQARVSAAWLRFTTSNSLQPIIDSLSAALGSLFVGINHQTTGNMLSYVQGLTAVTASGTTPQAVTVTGTPSSAYQMLIQITTTGGLGAGQFKWSINNGGSFVQTGQTIVASFAFNGPSTVTGLTAGFPAGTYTNGDTYTMSADPAVPWLSTLAHIDVQVAVPSGIYSQPNATGTPNALFYSVIGKMGPILDQALPFWTTWDWFFNSSLGTQSFRLDEPDLSLEAFT